MTPGSNRTPVSSKESQAGSAGVENADRDLRIRFERTIEALSRAPLVLWALDRDRRFTLATGRGFDALGIRSTDLLGEPIELRFGSNARVMENVRRGLAGETFQTWATVGGRRFEGWILPVHDDHGDVSGMISASVDVTDRTRIESALDEQARLLQTVLRNFPDPIFIKDGRGRYLVANTAAAQLLGRPTREILGKVADELLPEADAAMIYKHEETVRASGNALVTRETRTTRAGRRAYLMKRAPYRDAAGEVIGIVGIARDITEAEEAAEALSRSEEQLRHAQKMEAVGRLAGGIAHDFNNLLTALGCANSMLQALVEGSADAEALTEEIREVTSRGASLTRQLLTFSRRQVLQPRKIDPANASRNLMGMIRRLIGDEIDLELALEPGAGTIRIDPGHFDQILLNLVLNARDAIADRGRIEIGIRRARLDETETSLDERPRTGDYVAVTIADDGCGMSPEVMGRIFEPFFSTKDQHRGTGLGLSIVYSAVKQAGGYVACRSAPGEGTSLSTYFPRLNYDPESGSESASRRRIRKSEATILLVEDESLVRAPLARFLRRSGYRLFEARNADEALDRFRANQGQIDLVVTDLVMPGLGGRDVARHIERLEPDCPIIFISGHVDEAMSDPYALREGQVLLAKPFRPEALIEKIEEILGPGESSPGRSADPS